MRTKELLGAFEVLADAPLGIAQLRDLVLNLAVRGQLVPQHPSDEPATALRDRIAQERAKLVEQKGVRKPKALPPVSPEEEPFELPEAWTWMRLGEIASIFSGNSIPAAKKAAVYAKVEEGHPYIATKDVGYGRDELAYENGVRIPFSEPKFVVAEPGAVLVCSEGGSAGRKLGIVRRAVCFGNKLIANQAYAGVVPEYLFYFCQSPPFGAAFRTRMTGIIGGIALGKFVTIEFPLPPLKEQHRIVARVDELMALLDRLEEAKEARDATRAQLRDAALAALQDANDAEEVKIAWSRIADHLHDLSIEPADIPQFRQTVLRLAVRGRLVPQSPTCESADVLLKQAKATRAQLAKDRKLRKPKNPRPLDETPKPFDLPSGWQWCRFTDVGELARGRSKHRPRNDPALYEGGTIPMVQTGDVARACGTVTTHTALYNEKGLEQSRFWPAGTMCITIAANIADSALLGFDACFPDSVVGFEPFAPFQDARYFEYFMRTARSALQDFAPATAQKNINLAILDELLIPLPPLEELESIVAKVDGLMALLDRLEGTLRHSCEAQEAFCISATSALPRAAESNGSKHHPSPRNNSVSEEGAVPTERVEQHAVPNRRPS